MARYFIAGVLSLMGLCGCASEPVYRNVEPVFPDTQRALRNDIPSDWPWRESHIKRYVRQGSDGKTWEVIVNHEDILRGKHETLKRIGQ